MTRYKIEITEMRYNPADNIVNQNKVAAYLLPEWVTATELHKAYVRFVNALRKQTGGRDNEQQG